MGGAADPNIFDSGKVQNEAFYQKDDGSDVAGGAIYIPPTCGSLGNELISYEHDARTE